MIRFLARGLLLSWVALLLASCDSGNSGVNVPGVSGYTLTLQLLDAGGSASSSDVTANSPLLVEATLQAPGGGVVRGATIQFSASGIGRLGTLTAQTDTGGVASVILNAGTSATPGVPSAGVVTARFLDPSFNVASQAQPYTTLGDEVASGGGGGPVPTNVLRMTLLARDGGNGAISATNPITPLNPGRLVATVTLDGAPVANALVTFTAPSAVASLAQPSVATGLNGVGEVALTATASGAGSAGASVTHAGQTVNASVVVSTSVTATSSVTLALGNLTGGTFTNSELATSATGAIAAGSSISVFADVVNAATNVPYDTPVTVRFTSDCANQVPPKAVIDAQTSTVAGRAQVTYRAAGCVGNDTIRATLSDGSSTRTASALINVIEAPVAQLAFVSSVPTSISLAGTGGLGRLTRSEVTFRVLGEDGLPVGSRLVCFRLSTGVGGVTVSSSALSNSSGNAIAQVQAGTVPTAVRVQATVDTDGDSNCATVPNPATSAVSDALTVSTGLPDQNSFSLSFSEVNPNAFGANGVPVTVTVHSADHFNNPVPDGTAISFWSELGSIQPACTTVSGTCSVVWSSQSPRINRDTRPGITFNPLDGRAINDRAGRSTIVAYAVGEESFTDANGNGRFDVDEPFGNLGEVIKDSNENGVRDQPGLAFTQFEDEEFVDFDRNGILDSANLIYDGVLCAVAGAGCSGDATVNVRDKGVIVMSSSTLRLYVIDPALFNPSVIDYASNGVMTGMPAQISTLDLRSGLDPATGGKTLRFVLTDVNGNAPPNGTTITAKIDPSTAGSVVGISTHTVPSQTEYFTDTFTIRPPPSSPTNGLLTIEVKIGDSTLNYNIGVVNL